MDYKKKYKEALATIRLMKPDLNSTELEALETLIPELTESEDERNERIQKFIVETIFCQYGDSQEYLDVLAYLEKQKEQKPSWSEEDEKMKTTTLFYLEYSKKHCGCIIDIECAIAWLKSLPMRYPKKSDNWKPSEEQMKALDEYKNFRPALVSLYNDLKKL